MSSDLPHRHYFRPDAFYNSFYLSSIVKKISAGEINNAGLDIAYYTRIPGLSAMLASGEAVIKSINGQPAICFKQLSKFNPVVEDNSIRSGTGIDCKAFIPLPSNFKVSPDTTNIQQNKSQFYFRKNGRKDHLFLFWVSLGKYGSNSKLPPLTNGAATLNKLNHILIRDTTRLLNSFDTVIIYQPLFNEKATKRAIIDSLNKLINEADENDAVFFISKGTE